MKKIFSIDSYGAAGRAVLYHDQLFVPLSHSREYVETLCEDSSRMILINGEPIDFPDLSVEDFDFRFIDDYVLHTSRVLYSTYFSRRVNVRAILHKLRSFEFRYEFFNFTPEGYRKKAEKLISSVNDLRTSWFEKSRKSNCVMIVSLLKEALRLQDEELLLVDKYVSSRYLDGLPEGKIFLADAVYPAVFAKCKSYFKETERLYVESGITIPFFPLSFSMLLLEYGREKGTVSNHVRKRLSSSKRFLKKEYVAAARRRILFYDAHVDYCRKFGLGYGPLVSFDLHERPSSLTSFLSRPVRRFLATRKVKRALSRHL